MSCVVVSDDRDRERAEALGCGDLSRLAEQLAATEAKLDRWGGWPGKASGVVWSRRRGWSLW